MDPANGQITQLLAFFLDEPTTTVIILSRSRSLIDTSIFILIEGEKKKEEVEKSSREILNKGISPYEVHIQ